MFKKFETKELVLVALFASLAFSIAFFVGSWLATLTGIGLMPSIINAIFVGAIFSFLCLTIKKFWTATMAMTIYSLLAIPTVLFGYPGAYKIIPAVLGGLTFDSLNSIFGYRKKGYYLGWDLCLLVMFIFLVIFYILLGLPGKDKLIGALPIVILVALSTGLIGVWLGIFLFEKIKNKHFIKQFRK